MHVCRKPACPDDPLFILCLFVAIYLFQIGEGRGCCVKLPQKPYNDTGSILQLVLVHCKTVKDF